MYFSKMIVQCQIILISFVTNITSPRTLFLHMLKSDMPFGIVQSWYSFVA